jgi:uncharacterized protein
MAHATRTDGRSLDRLDQRRRVAAATGLGATTLLGVSLSARPGSPRFYGLTLGAASVYTAGGLAAGPIPLDFEAGDRDARRRSVLGAAAAGVGTFVAFYLIALVARYIPILNRAIRSILDFAHHGSMPLVAFSTLTTGASEEVYFRGALYGVLPGATGVRAVSWSTASYAVATAVGTRNPALVLASIVMGALFAAQRRSTGGILAPTITHLVWSSLMLRYMPPLFPPPDEA